MNNKYDEINIPDNIDLKIENGVKLATEEKSKSSRHKRKKAIGIVIAILVGFISIDIVSPALATKIPIVGRVFETIEKEIYFPGNYAEYATSINEKAYSNGIGVTLSEIVCDGQSLYVTYVVESDEPFKDVSYLDSEELNMNQLLMEQYYNKVDFTDERLDNSGIAGLEGKFIDKNTFVGVDKYHLSLLESEIPDEFVFQTKIAVIGNYAKNQEDKDYYKWGTWAFKVPVTVNKNLKRNVDLTKEDVESNNIKIQSISITPFDMVIDVSYDEYVDNNYIPIVYDENGQELQVSMSQTSDDKLSEKMFSQAPNLDSNYVRIILFDMNDEGEEQTIGSKKKKGSIVFDKTIKIK